MRLEDYPTYDGKRVWLSRDEVDALLSVYRGDDIEKYLALALAALSGLRKVLDVRHPLLLAVFV